MTLSLRDKIAFLVGSGLGVAFAYLAMLFGYGGILVGGFYGILVIPLVVVYLADQRKLLVWQASITSFAIYIVAANARLGGLGPREGVAVFLEFWAVGVVISSPAPAYYYLQCAKKRKSYRIELFLVGLAFLIVLSSLWNDPFVVLAVGMAWIVVWFAKCLWGWRLSPDQSDTKKTALVVVSVFILAGLVPLLAATFFKQRAFSLAVRKDHLGVAGCLLAIGADPNALDVYGQTALGEAAWDGNTRAVAWLLSMGAKPDVEGKAEFQGLMPSGTALALAASVGRAKICRSLLVAGADPNKRNEHGTTPLLAALSHWSLGCVPDLLDHGADVNARTAGGETPLMLIAQFDLQGDPVARHVLDQLLAGGADVSAKDDKGRTAEDWAVLYHRDELATRLRVAGRLNQKKP